MRLIALLCLGCLMLMSAEVSAKAQREFSEAETRKFMQEFGDCKAYFHMSMARRAIIENADLQTMMSKYQRLVDTDCLPRDRGVGTVRMSGDVILYAIAGGYVRRILPRSPAFDFSGVSPLSHRLVPPLDTELLNSTAEKDQAAVKQHKNRLASLALSLFTECVSRNAPAEVLKLIVSKVGSKKEKIGFVAIGSTMSDCLGTGQVNFSREALRGALSLAFARLALAQTERALD